MAVEGGVILKYIISGLFNYVEPNGYLKILIRCVWENDERGRGLVAFQSLSTIINFQSIEPFSKFLRQLFRCEVPGSKKICPHRSLLRQHYCAAYDLLISVF